MRLLLLSVALSALCAVQAAPTSLRMDGDRKKQSMAFADSFLPVLQARSMEASACSFVGDRSFMVAGSSINEVAEGMQGLSMSCRRNLKKEKRHRNEVMARQFRKPTFGRFRGRGGRGGGRAAQAAQTEADSEWLDQIYGQHTIYRRDEGAASSAGDAQEESEGAKKEQPEAVAA